MTYAHHASRRVAHDMMEGDLIDESLSARSSVMFVMALVETTLGQMAMSR